MKLIVAVDNNWGIGKNGNLLYSIPDDMKYFRKTTTGHPIIMGRKTLESFPNGNPLKNRRNLVLTKGEIEKNVEVCHNVSDVFLKLGKEVEDAFVIGGGTIYEQFLPFCDTAYITKIHANFEADTFFPALTTDDWKMINSSRTKEYEGILYNFEIWKRKDSDLSVSLTESEVETLKFYLKKNIIDAEGLCAIGIGNEISVKNLHSILRKINEV